MMSTPKDTSSLRALFLISGLALFHAPQLAAQSATYLPSTGTTSWNEGTNWSTGIVPNAPDAIALLPGASSGSPITNIAGTIQLGRLEADLTGGSWRVGQTGTGSIQWNTSSGAPSLFVTNNGATARSLTIQARLLDPLSGVAQPLTIGASGVGESAVLFSGNNSGFTGGFNLTAPIITSLAFTTTESMGTNAVSVSGADHRLRFGTGEETRHFYGNIAIGSDVSNLRISTNASAGGSAVLHGVISGNAGVDFRRYGNGDLELRGVNTYTGKTLIASGISLTFNSVANFGTGDDLELAFSSGSPTLIYAAGNSDDLTKKADGSLRNVNFRNAKGTIDTNGNDVTFENRITSFLQTGTGLVKKGDGILRLLAGNNSYGLETEVLGGTLLVNNASGSATGTSSVLVEATLGGNGRLAPGGAASIRIASGGTLAPGDLLPGQIIDTLTVDLTETTGSLAFADASRLAFDLGDSGAADLLMITSSRTDSVIFEGETILEFFDRSIAGLTEGDFTLFSAESANIYSGLILSGNEIIGGLVIGSINSSYQTQLLLDGGDILLRVQAIPEPSTLAFTAIAAGLFVWRRRSLKAS